MRISERFKFYAGLVMVGLFVGSIIGLSYLNVRFYSDLLDTLSDIKVEFDIRDLQHYDDMNQLRETINKLAELTIQSDLAQLEWNIEQQSNIESALEFIKVNKESQIKNALEINRITYRMQEQELEIIDRLENVKSLDLSDVVKIKEANVTMRNIKRDYVGSGTHIKIKGKSYILSCAHLLKKENDGMIAYIDTNHKVERELTLVKINKELDMTLWAIGDVNNLGYLELAPELPKAGSEVIVIGNPAYDSDMITDGIISKVGDNRFLITNLIFHGNSGGAVIYKGKIIGMLIAGRWYNHKDKTHIAYGIATRLYKIKDFISDIEVTEQVNEEKNSN